MLRRVAVAVLTFVCAAAVVGAQTVDEVVSKNIEAHGGAAKLKAVKTIKATGKVEIGPGMEAPAVQYQSRPNHIRREFTLQGMTAVQAYDGTQAWGIMPFMGKKDPDLMSAEERDEMIDESDMDGPLVDYAQKGNKVEFLGKDKLEGTDVYKLRVTLKTGAIETLYIDTDSNLEIRVDSERMVRGTAHKATTVIGDYKQIDGIAEPFSIETSDQDHPEQKAKVTFEKIEFNIPVDDKMFAMPPKTAATTPGAATGEDKPASPDQKPPADTPKNDTPKQ